MGKNTIPTENTPIKPEQVKDTVSSEHMPISPEQVKDTVSSEHMPISPEQVKDTVSSEHMPISPEQVKDTVSPEHMPITPEQAKDTIPSEISLIQVIPKNSISTREKTYNFTISCQSKELHNCYFQEVETSKTYFPYVTFALIIIGWNVIYRNAKRLATRNETKSLIDDAMKSLQILEDLTLNYWLSRNESSMKADEFQLLVAARLEAFNNQLQQIQRRNINIDDVDLANLSEFMTLNCESVDITHVDEHRIQVQYFLEQANLSRVSLFNDFENRHKPSYGFVKYLQTIFITNGGQTGGQIKKRKEAMSEIT
jgi:hypothetical protein